MSDEEDIREEAFEVGYRAYCEVIDSSGEPTEEALKADYNAWAAKRKEIERSIKALEDELEAEIERVSAPIHAKLGDLFDALVDHDDTDPYKLEDARYADAEERADKASAEARRKFLDSKGISDESE